MSGPYSRKAFSPSSNNANTKRSNNNKNKNTSILNFFQKTDRPPPPVAAKSRQVHITQFTTKSSERFNSGHVQRGSSYSRGGSGGGGGNNVDSLFMEDPRFEGTTTNTSERLETTTRSPTPDIFWQDENNDMGIMTGTGTGTAVGIGNGEEERFNETSSTIKRRKVVEEEKDVGSSLSTGNLDEGIRAPVPVVSSSKVTKRTGPFIDESDSEDDLEGFVDDNNGDTFAGGGSSVILPSQKKEEGVYSPDIRQCQGGSPGYPTLPLHVKEAASNSADDGFADFNDTAYDVLHEAEGPLENFQGEESENEGENENEDEEMEEDSLPWSAECNEESVCPICQTPLLGLSEMVACS